MTGSGSNWKDYSLKIKYRRLVNLLKLRMETAELTLVNAQMNAVFQSSMQSVLRPEQVRQSIIRSYAR